MSAAAAPRLRPVAPGDEALLLRIYASTRAEELAAVPWSDADKAAFLRMQFDAQHAHYQSHYTDGGTFDVVLVGDEPAGRLYVHRGPREIRIVDIALLPAFRGQGVGSQLLAALLAEADASGRAASIHVERHNPALRLYARLGFVPAGETGVYVLMRREPR
jgi:ribosomal protein S18 acetylase RimI-like enzyme